MHLGRHVRLLLTQVVRGLKKHKTYGMSLARGFTRPERSGSITVEHGVSFWVSWNALSQELSLGYLVGRRYNHLKTAMLKAPV